MRRWLFNLAAAVSLVLCVAVGVLGVRSFWHIDAAGARSDAWPQPDKFREREWEVASVSGTLRFVYKQSFSQVGWNESIGWVHEQSPPRLNWYRLAPESWVCISRTSGGFAAEHDVSFPFGQPMTLGGLLTEGVANGRGSSGSGGGCATPTPTRVAATRAAAMRVSGLVIV